MSWHGHTDVLEAYSRGGLDPVGAASLEAHLLQCARCRAGVADLAPRDIVGRGWAAISDELDAPQPGLLERSLVRAGTSDHVARILAATPSLRLSWFAAVAVSLAFAVTSARFADEGVLLFLIVAPLVPLAGVAAFYGPGVDPTYEIGLAAPMRSSSLLLLRAIAVLTTSVVLSGIAALALPGLDWTALAWLLPALCLTASALALSTVLHPLVATGAVGVLWVAVVTAVEQSSATPLAAFRGPIQVAFLALSIVAVLALMGRREHLEMRRNG